MACFANEINIVVNSSPSQCDIRAWRGGGGCINNTALGVSQTLTSNSTGYCNTAIGSYALRCNTSGNRNTAAGVRALRNNTTGTCNTAIGYKAGYCMTTGNNLTAIGAFAAYCTTGNCNTAIGFNAGNSLTTGTCNVIIGCAAGCGMSGGSCNVAIGWRAMRDATSNNNIAIGHQVAPDLTTGACNIFVGYCNGSGISTTNFHIGIGHGSSPSKTTGHTAWGNSAITYNGIACEWTDISDCRDKTNIQDLDEKLGLDFIRSLDTVSFNWDNRENYVQKYGFEYGQKDGTLTSPKKSYGFIAQQMKEVLDNLNTDFDALKYNEDKDAYRITYAHMIAPLVKAIQQTIQRIETLETLAG
jgi:hypothetical protein